MRIGDGSQMRLLPTLLIGLCFASTLLAQGADFKKANREYQYALKKEAIDEGKFFRETSKRLREAYETFRAPWVEWYGKPDAPADIFYDLSGYRTLYSEIEAIGDRRASAAVALAASDRKEAAAILWKQMLAVQVRIKKLEKQLSSARAVMDDYHYDQEPVLRLLGNQRFLEGLVRALGSLRSAEALGWLADKGWKEAAQTDRRTKGVGHRVALLDAFASTGSPTAFDLLRTARKEPELPVRVAALEGLLRFRETKKAEVVADALETLREEKAFPIRITALRALKILKAANAVGPLIDVLQAEVESRDGGVLCGHILEILREFTGKDFGLSLVNWKGWYEKNKARFEDGSFKREGEGEAKEGEGKKKMKTVTFYDIPTYSKGIVILIDASDTLIIPADIDIAGKHSVFYWLEASSRKLKEYKSQLDVLKEEAEKAIGAMDGHTLFNVLLLYKDDRREACWPKMMPATSVNKAKALSMIRDVKAGGWTPQYAGLLDALRIAGLDPYKFDFDAAQADTFYLLTDGGICGGRFMTPKALVESVGRLNRFRNVTINTVQIADLGPDAVEFLKGVADATGGTYLWRKK